jgi:gamma-tubulin complex component 4
MSFIVDNIYAYLQVDVLESQWSKLVETINQSRDFEDVRLLHDRYLASITDQCFLNISPVLKAL